MSTPAAFQSDESYDRDQASDGRSRYGAYLAQKRGMFLDVNDEPTVDPLEFAAAAWEIAQSPIMSPPYVRVPARVQSAEATWDYENNLAITVTVALPDPPVIAQMRRARGWQRDSVSGRWYDPDDCGRLTALCLARIRVPVRAGDLPLADYHDTIPVTRAAKAAVARLCDLLNRELSGVLHD